MFGKISRPVAEVFLRATSGKWYRASMYIDSGADITLLPRQFGEKLGLTFDKNKIQEIKGIGEAAVPIVITNIRLKIGEKEFDARVAFSLIEEVPIILGRTDVFDLFKVIFDQENKVVIFEGK